MIKILVIGCGSIGKRHALNASQLVDTGLHDVDSEKAIAIANELNIESFNTLEEAFEWNPTITIVATPTHTHLNIAEMAIQANTHVLIEKPISNSINGVKKFLQKAYKLNRKVFVVCNMRFHPAIARIKQCMSKIGKPLYSRAYYGNYLPDMRPGVEYQQLYCAKRSMGGGVVLDAIHEIDYLIWFFGPVRSVTGVTAKLSNLDIDVEDYAAVVLEHINGVRSEIHLDYFQRCKRRGLEIVGEQGTILWQSIGKIPEKCRVEIYSTNTRKWDTVIDDKQLSYSNMYALMLDTVLSCINNNSPDDKMLSGHMAADELVVALLAIKSADKKKTLYIIE